MPEPEERDELITRLAGLQRGVAQALARDRMPPMLHANLTMQQLRVVVKLALDGPAAGQVLAQQLGVTLGTVTGIVDRLVAHGLVVRSEDPKDRRVRRIALSPEGAELVDRILDHGTNQFRRLLERLDTATLHQLEDVMRKLHEAAADLGP